METTRVYGRVRNVYITGKGWMKTNRWNIHDAEMLEVEYTDYYDDGTICGKGTEDFSRERMKSLRRGCYEVKKDSGEKTATGRTKWDIVGTYAVMATRDKFAKAVKFWKQQYASPDMKVIPHYINRCK